MGFFGDATDAIQGVIKGGMKKTGITMFDKTDSIMTPLADPTGYTYGGNATEEARLRAQYQQQGAAADGRQLDWAQADQAREQGQQARTGQSALSQSYQSAINGTGPSVARAQLYAGQQANAQQNAAMAAGTRGGGGNVLAAQRNAQRQAAMSGQATNRDAAMLRAQETAAAMSGQGALLNGMRQGDAAQQQQDTGRQVQQTQLNDQRSALYQGAEQHLNDQKLAGSMSYQKDRIGAEQRSQEFNAGLSESDKKRKNELLSKGASAVGPGVMAAAL